VNKSWGELETEVGRQGIKNKKQRELETEVARQKIKVGMSSRRNLIDRE
jgi:hypothetical protein